MSSAIPLSFDCSKCLDRDACGTLPDAGFWGCFDHCINSCKGAECEFTCPHNPILNFHRWMDVEGKADPKLDYSVPNLDLPVYIPTIHGKASRKTVVESEWVALPLGRLFNFSRREAIQPIARTATELRRQFLLRPDARVIATGVGPDAIIERIWSHHKVEPLAQWLKAMGVEAITAPNYSYFAYAPREHFLWNRKRMLLFSKRVGEKGVPVIPHLYGETNFDWSWWARYFKNHPSISSFSIELQTGDAEKNHLSLFVEGLARFQEGVGRNLTPIVVGGRHAISLLVPYFPSMSIIDSTAYMRAVKRRFVVSDATLVMRWKPIKTLGDIAPLLNHNIRFYGDAISAQFSTARARTGKTQTVAA